MDRVKTFKKTRTFENEDGSRHILLLYAELREVETLRGVEIRPVEYKRGSKEVTEVLGDVVNVKLDDTFGTRKEFNYGWAVCSATDKYDEEKGIEIAKKRFAKSPLTTQTGTFLTDDMINAILDNEINYIYENKLRDTFTHPVVEPTPKREKPVVAERCVNKEHTPQVAEKFKNGDIVVIAWKDTDALTYAAYDKIVGKRINFHWKITISGNKQNFQSPWAIENVQRVKNVRKATEEETESLTEKLQEEFGAVWSEKEKKLHQIYLPSIYNLFKF